MPIDESFIVSLVSLQLQARENGKMHLADLYKNLKVVMPYSDMGYATFLSIVGKYRILFDVPDGEIGADVNIIGRKK